MITPRIIQVEVTTTCQARCKFCPRTLLKDSWISRHIEWDDFIHVIPTVKKGVLVHLQGWGEPLLHPRLWDMARAVKQRQGKVSLTTNGLLLDEAASREICRIGFDFIAVSLADAIPHAHHALRTGARLEPILSNVAFLCGLKPRPRVHFVVQMMKSNMARLPAVVELAAKLGADRVIASNLDCIVNGEVDELRAFSNEASSHYQAIIEETKRRGRELKIRVEIYPLRLQYNVPVCKANPLHTALLTVSGEVAPCVYLSPPVKGDVPRIFHGQIETLPRFVYGRISDGFARVINVDKARSFLDAFNSRARAAMLNTAGQVALLAMPRVRSTQGAFLEPGARLVSPSGTTALPPAPEPCLHCYKLYGI